MNLPPQGAHQGPHIPHDSGRLMAVREYFNLAAKDYGQKSEQGAWGWLKNAEFNAVANQLGEIEGLKILEIGCGAGWYARRLSLKRPGAYIALDSLFSMAVKARSYGIEAMAADSMTLPFKSAFDAALCAGALEFMESPPMFFKEAARALKPGGRAVLLAPTKSLAGRVYRWWHRRHGFEIHLFSLEDIRAMAAPAGLRLAGVSKAGLFNMAVRLEKEV